MLPYLFDRKDNLLSCKSYNPENPGSDERNLGITITFSVFSALSALSAIQTEKNRYTDK